VKTLLFALLIFGSFVATSCKSNPVSLDNTAQIRTDYLYFSKGVEEYQDAAVVFIKNGSSWLGASVANHTVSSYRAISSQEIEVNFKTISPECGVDFTARFVQTPIKFSELKPATPARPFDGLYFVPLLKELYCCTESGLHTYFTDTKIEGHYAAQFNDAKTVSVPDLNWIIGTNPITPQTTLTGIYSIRASYFDQHKLYLGSSDYLAFDVIGQYLLQ
jgi:hypothetical protein